MTTQPPQQELDRDERAGLPPLEIEDNTSDDQKAIEASEEPALRDELPEEPEQPEAVEEESESPEEEAPEPSGQAPEASEEEPEPQERTFSQSEVSEEEPEPQERTFSQSEVSKMQAAWERQIAGERQQRESAQKQLDSFNLNAAVEAQLRQQEEALTAQYGEESARQIVRTRANIDAVQRSQVLEQENKQLKADRDQQGREAELQAKDIVARQLMQQHNLDADDYGTLLTTSSPQAMVTLAQRLAPRAPETPAAPADRVPPASPERRVTTGRSTGQGETLEQKKSRIANKMGGEWTEEELRIMRSH